MTDTADIKALRPTERAKLGFVTDDNTGGYYVAECEECGNIFPSQTCDGGEQIADTGDYGDCYCPLCGHVDPQECDNANLVWNVQQLKIVNLTKQLEAERQRADAADSRLHEVSVHCANVEAELATLKGDQVPVALSVWYGSMPESNGKENWTAILHRKGVCISEGITVDRSEYPERVRYAVDCMRYLIGEIQDEPDILAYDAGKRSDYVYPVTAPQKPVVVTRPPMDDIYHNKLSVWVDGFNYASKGYDANIKAAGGIVKDGE